MTGTETAPATGDRRRKKAKKPPIWKRDLHSLGRKSVGDDEVEHEPFTPTLPQVNLLPTSVRESMAVGRIRRWIVAVVVLLAIVVGGLWWLQGSTIATAESDVARATTENGQLRTQVEALTPVKQMYEQITSLQELVKTTLAAQPQAAVVIGRLANAASGVTGKPIAFTSADVTYSGIPAAGAVLNPCPNPNPFGSEITIGCLTFNATAANRQQVSELLRLLEADPLFIGPYVTSSTSTTLDTGKGGTSSTVAFSGSAGVSLDALRTLLTPEQVQAILTPPAPQPEPTASGAAS